MKKVLIITYRWPPAGGIGVLRCLKFVKYLRDFGWEPIVLTAKNASYQFLDYDNLKEVPDEIEIHRVPIFEPINAFKKINLADVILTDNEGIINNSDMIVLPSLSSICLVL